VERSLQESWEDEAGAWIAWARRPDHDHWYWRMTRPAVLELLPAPRRLTVDVGCGEGRLARELLGLGHTVVGVEPSARLREAARSGAPPIDARAGLATDLPLPDGAADLAVASMMLMDLDDQAAGVAEIARVLEPGGRLVFCVVHPANSIVAAREALGPEVSYFAEARYAFHAARDGLEMTFHDIHRPLGQLMAAFEAAGLLVEALREPVPDDDHVAAHPSVVSRRRDPIFLAGRLLKPARS
jgi:SAM-dependent methyltransferase